MEEHPPTLAFAAVVLVVGLLCGFIIVGLAAVVMEVLGLW